MSFSGPTAPEDPQRRQIRPDLLRLMLAAAFAAALTALGFCGLMVSTAPAWVSIAVQPCSLLLLPGYLAESLDKNAYSFSGHSVLWVSGACYFSIALLFLFPKSGKATYPR